MAAMSLLNLSFLLIQFSEVGSPTLKKRALGLESLFEWGGSLAIGRSVQEILTGWNIFAG